jgi:hypothetical protein
MVTIPLHCPHCQSEALVRNGHVPNGKQLYRCRACGRQSRENPTARRSRTPLKNAAVCEVLRAPLGSRTRPCPVGSKKELSFRLGGQRCWPRMPKIPRPRLLDVDGPLSPDAASGGICGWGSEQPDVPAVVGGHCRGISAGALLHGLVGGLRGGDSRGTPLRCGQRDGRNRPCRAVK